MRKPLNRPRVRLLGPITRARAGLIPSCETDANPPPDCLTARQLLRWYRGLWVQCDAGSTPFRRRKRIEIARRAKPGYRS